MKLWSEILSLWKLWMIFKIVICIISICFYINTIIYFSFYSNNSCCYFYCFKMNICDYNLHPTYFLEVPFLITMFLVHLLLYIFCKLPRVTFCEMGSHINFIYINFYIKIISLSIFQSRYLYVYLSHINTNKKNLLWISDIFLVFPWILIALFLLFLLKVKLWIIFLHSIIGFHNTSLLQFCWNFQNFQQYIWSTLI